MTLHTSSVTFSEMGIMELFSSRKRSGTMNVLLSASSSAVLSMYHLLMVRRFTTPAAPIAHANSSYSLP